MVPRAEAPNHHQTARLKPVRLAGTRTTLDRLLMCFRFIFICHLRSIIEKMPKQKKITASTKSFFIEANPSIKLSLNPATFQLGVVFLTNYEPRSNFDHRDSSGVASNSTHIHWNKPTDRGLSLTTARIKTTIESSSGPRLHSIVWVVLTHRSRPQNKLIGRINEPTLPTNESDCISAQSVLIQTFPSHCLIQSAVKQPTYKPMIAIHHW